MSKLPNESTTEELLSLLDNDIEEVILGEDTNDSVLQFIGRYNLKPGYTRVRGKLLYKLYKNTTEEPLSKMSFSLALGNYIPNKHGYFRINKKAIEITQTLLTELKAKKKHDVNTSKTYREHFDRFLKQCDIKPGKYYVPRTYLYNIYTTWRENTQETSKIIESKFILLLKFYFNRKRLEEGKFVYGIERRNEVPKEIKTQQEQIPIIGPEAKS